LIEEPHAGIFLALPEEFLLPELLAKPLIGNIPLESELS